MFHGCLGQFVDLGIHDETYSKFINQKIIIMKNFIEIVNGVNNSPMWKNNEKESRYKVVQFVLFLSFEYPDFNIAKYFAR